MRPEVESSEISGLDMAGECDKAKLHFSLSDYSATRFSGGAGDAPPPPVATASDR